MSVPRSVNIKGVKYKIKFVKDLCDDGISLDGDVCMDKKVIRIRKGMNERDMIHSIAHECFHAALSEIGVHHTDLSDNLEHIIVDNLASVVADNWVLKWTK